MKLNKPKVITWWIAVILGVLGVIANFVAIPILSGIAFWLVVIGLALLALANVTKGL
jgi:heme/copper-type cytochrome/quinol oxidase subunit 1